MWRPTGTAGTAEPVRIATASGRNFPLYAPPAGTPDTRPWVAAEPLFDAVGLAPERRADFAERNRLLMPGMSNIVRAPTGRVNTLSPAAAALCIDLARRAGLPAATVAELMAMIGAE